MLYVGSGRSMFGVVMAAGHTLLVQMPDGMFGDQWLAVLVLAFWLGATIDGRQAMAMTS